MPKVTLKRLEGGYAISRLDPDAPIPVWADGAGFSSISRTEDELSIVSRAERIPAGVRHDIGWTCYRFVGPFAFDETGIVSSVIGPLSAKGFGIFVVSTFDGDHLLLKTATSPAAEEILAEAGHTVI